MFLVEQTVFYCSFNWKMNSLFCWRAIVTQCVCQMYDIRRKIGGDALLTQLGRLRYCGHLLVTLAIFTMYKWSVLSSIHEKSANGHHLHLTHTLMRTYHSLAWIFQQRSLNALAKEEKQDQVEWEERGDFWNMFHVTVLYYSVTYRAAPRLRSHWEM